jgi:hypothetical protein
LFYLAQIQLLNDDPKAENTAREFLATDHFYHDYIRFMTYWRLMLNGKSDQAQSYLDERWTDIDPNTWDDRLRHADVHVWREKLIGYYLGKVDRGQIFNHLESRKTFENSEYRALGSYGLSFEGMRAEANFYDALLQNVSGDEDTRQERYRQALQRTLDQGRPDMLEYQMANVLLKDN